MYHECQLAQPASSKPTSAEYSTTQQGLAGSLYWRLFLSLQAVESRKACRFAAQLFCLLFLHPHHVYQPLAITITIISHGRLLARDYIRFWLFDMLCEIATSALNMWLGEQTIRCMPGHVFSCTSRKPSCTGLTARKPVH